MPNEGPSCPIIEARLKELGITLSTPPVPVAAYVPYTLSGNLVFISGQVPLSDGALKYVGKLGVDFSVEMGQAAAQLCAINVLAQLKVACDGDLDRVVRCLKLRRLRQRHARLSPSSRKWPMAPRDLIAAVFGDAGKHARAAVGVGSLPRGVAVEVDAIFEIK